MSTFTSNSGFDKRIGAEDTYFRNALFGTKKKRANRRNMSIRARGRPQKVRSPKNQRPPFQPQQQQRQRNLIYTDTTIAKNIASICLHSLGRPRVWMERVKPNLNILHRTSQLSWCLLHHLQRSTQLAHFDCIYPDLISITLIPSNLRTHTPKRKLRFVFLPDGIKLVSAETALSPSAPTSSSPLPPPLLARSPTRASGLLFHRKNAEKIRCKINE